MTRPDFQEITAGNLPKYERLLCGECAKPFHLGQTIVQVVQHKQRRTTPYHKRCFLEIRDYV